MAGEHPKYAVASLETCEEEPIHVPGAIQPHGALLAVDGERVVAASSNCAALLGLDAASLLGEPVASHLEVEAPPGADRRAEPEDLAPLAVRFAGRPFAALRHRNAQGLEILELEPPTDPTRTVASLVEALRLAERLQGEDDLGPLLEAAAHGARALSGFDRAYVYRFHRDLHGEVVAEAADAELEPILGLHYPASDIPGQARRLYVRNRIRAIAHVDAVPSRLLVDTNAPLPIDLSDAWLRAVSPLHLEYMRNVGTAASASVSILRGGELWGLIALHHRRPRMVSVDVRLALGLLGRTVSTQVDLRLTAHEQERLNASHREMARLLDEVRRHSALPPSLVGRSANLLGLIDSAKGAVVILDGEVERVGRCPASSVLVALAHRLFDARRGEVVETLSLREEGLDAGLDPRDVAGLLAVPLSDTRPDYLFWLKPEAQQTIRWAGHPDDGVKVSATGDPSRRLRPRTSFTTFVESVSGRALEFEAWERRVAELLGTTIGHVARRLDDVAQAMDLRSRAEAKFRALFEHSPHAMVVVDSTDGQITLVNPAFARLVESDEELRGRPLSSLVPEATQEAIDRLVDEPVEPPLWHIGQRRAWPRVLEPSAVRLSMEAAPATLVTLVDNTGHVLAEHALRENAAALERANHELDRFVSVASHDLRAPLRAIRNLGDWIAEDAGPALPPASKVHLERLLARAERLDRLFNDLLEYARAGRGVEDRRPVDLTVAIRECFDLVAGESAFTLDVEVPAAPLMLRCVELQTILRNLMANAVQHHDHPPGRVSVRGVATDGRLVLDVADDGPGIPARLADRLFEVFTTLGPKQDGAGSGMGLAMVRRLAERDGGSVHLLPRAGRGSTFRLLLPLEDGSSVPAGEA